MRTLGLLALSMLLLGCTQAFFHPQRLLVDTPQRHGIEYRAESFPASDGTPLAAWFLPAGNTAGGRVRATILFLHGNAENISTHFRSVAWLPAEGFNVLMLDYRGYGDSQGMPSLAGVQLDIDAALRRLIGDANIDAKRIVLFGQSLGGALAIYYAAHSAYRADLRAVVIDSAFSDYRLIAQEKLAGFFVTWPLQWLPRLTVDDDYSPLAAVGAITPVPLLLIHGDEDMVIPSHHSQMLFDRAAEPKELWIVPGAGHTQALRNGAVRRRLVEYLLLHTE